MWSGAPRSGGITERWVWVASWAVSSVAESAWAILKAGRDSEALEEALEGVLEGALEGALEGELVRKLWAINGWTPIKVSARPTLTQPWLKKERLVRVR